MPTQRITIIFGNSGSGKSFLANQLSLMYDNAVFVPCGKSSLDKVFSINDIGLSEDLIILDDMLQEDIHKVLCLFFNETIDIKLSNLPEFVNRRTPKVLITAELDETFLLGLGPSAIRRCNLIKTSIVERKENKVFTAKRIL